jgi:hypothetical protein
MDTKSMNIPMTDSRSLSIKYFRGDVEIWLNDSLTRSQKMLANYRGGRYSKVDPEFISVIKNDAYNTKLLKAIKSCYEEPQAEFTKRWNCLKRSVILQILLLKRSI